MRCGAQQGAEGRAKAKTKQQKGADGATDRKRGWGDAFESDSDHALPPPRKPAHQAVPGGAAKPKAPRPPKPATVELGSTVVAVDAGAPPMKAGRRKVSTLELADRECALLSTADGNHPAFAAYSTFQRCVRRYITQAQDEAKAPDADSKVARTVPDHHIVGYSRLCISQRCRTAIY